MSTTRPNIAIVDDDESVCRAISRLLRFLGMDTNTFTSSHEFIEHVEATRSLPPDCVVLDIQMPGMSGLEVQNLLIRSENPLPVIFITAHDEVSVRNRRFAPARWPSYASRSMTSYFSGQSMKLLKDIGRRKDKESGRVHGGASWYGG